MTPSRDNDPTPPLGIDAPDPMDGMQTPQYRSEGTTTFAPEILPRRDSSSTSRFPGLPPRGSGDTPVAEFSAPTAGATMPSGEMAIPYLVRRLVGSGGFGEVWEAVQTSLGRTVALKRMRADMTQTTTMSREEIHQIETVFRQEALATAFLEHPNIVPVHDLGSDENDQPVLVMKLMRGERWDDLIGQDFPLPVPDFLGRHLPILVSISQAIAFAHSRGILHRDLKPSQAMLGEFGEVVLMDWGIAICYDPALAAEHFAEQTFLSTIPTRANAQNPSGTPSFMAPEQTEDTGTNLGPWTDIYQLGGTLYYLLTGTAPHRAEDAADSFFLAMKGVVEHPRERNRRREIPPALAATAMRALSADRADRHANVQEFIAEIEDYLTGAGRRRESIALSSQAAARVEGAAGSYRELSDCNELILRAMNLWPENPAAQLLRQRVLRDFSRAALANSDLTLARLMAEYLDEGEDRRVLIHTIGARERELRRQHRQRRLLMVVSFVLLIVVLLDFIILFGWDNAARRASAQSALEDAQAQLRSKRQALSMLEDYGPDRLPGYLLRVDNLRAGEARAAIEAAARLQLHEDPAGEAQMLAALRADEAGTQALFAELARLRTEREALGGVFDEALGVAPLPCTLARPLLELAEARSARDLARARAIFADAARDHPNAYEPIAGQALCLARAGMRGDALALLDNTLDRWGSNPELVGYVQRLTALRAQLDTVQATPSVGS